MFDNPQQEMQFRAELVTGLAEEFLDHWAAMNAEGGDADDHRRHAEALEDFTAIRPLLEAAPQMLETLKAVERAFGRVERLPQDDKPGGAKVRVLYRVRTAILKTGEPS